MVDSYLNVSSIGGGLVECDSIFGLACGIETSSCFSFNFAGFPNVKGQLFCKRLSSDKYYPICCTFLMAEVPR